MYECLFNCYWTSLSQKESRAVPSRDHAWGSTDAIRGLNDTTKPSIQRHYLFKLPNALIADGLAPGCRSHCAPVAVCPAWNPLELASQGLPHLPPSSALATMKSPSLALAWQLLLLVRALSMTVLMGWQTSTLEHKLSSPGGGIAGIGVLHVGMLPVARGECGE